MLELEKKIETKNIEVRADFTRELVKVNKKPDTALDQQKLHQAIESQISKLEAHFKSQFTRRVEIVEEAIDSTVSRMDNFMQNCSLDAGKQQKLEQALKD